MSIFPDKHEYNRRILAELKKGDTEIVHELLQEVDANSRGYLIQALLQWASHEGVTEILAFLLDRGACVNARYEDGWTLLHWAASNGRYETVTFQLDRGADVNARAVGGMTPLFKAVQNGRTETADLLQQHGGVE